MAVTSLKMFFLDTYLFTHYLWVTFTIFGVSVSTDKRSKIKFLKIVIFENVDDTV